MGNIYLKPTKVTPLINFDFEQGILEFKGKSSPENPLKFYSPVIDRLVEFSGNGHRSLKVNIFFEYFNTGSSKVLYDLLKRLVQMAANDFDVSIHWFYEEDDEDMLETGEDFSELLGFEFEFIESEL